MSTYERLGVCPRCGNVPGELLDFLETRDEHADKAIEARNRQLSELAVQRDELLAALKDMVDLFEDRDFVRPAVAVV
jgi:hypothetical protein